LLFIINKKYICCCRVLCVCLSIRLSVTSRYWIETTGQIELVLAIHASFAYPSPYYKEIRVPPKIRVLPSGTLSPNSELRKFRHARQVDRVVNKTRRRSSLLITLTTVDASSLFGLELDFHLLWICGTTGCITNLQQIAQQIKRLQHVNVLKVADINKSATNPQQIEVMEFEPCYTSVDIFIFIHSYSFNNGCQTAGVNQNKTICRPRNIQVNKHTNTKF